VKNNKRAIGAVLLILLASALFLPLVAEISDDADATPLGDVTPAFYVKELTYDSDTRVMVIIVHGWESSSVDVKVWDSYTTNVEYFTATDADGRCSITVSDSQDLAAGGYYQITVLKHGTYLDCAYWLQIPDPTAILTSVVYDRPSLIMEVRSGITSLDSLSIGANQIQNVSVTSGTCIVSWPWSLLPNTEYQVIASVGLESCTYVITTPNAYNVTSTIDGVENIVQVYYEEDCTISYTSAYLESVTVDGSPVSIVTYSTGYTFTNVTADHTIVVLHESVLTGISVTTPPTKTAYVTGEAFSNVGMVVTATYNDGSTAVVGYTYSPTGALSPANTSITISYTEGTITKTTSQAITVTTPTPPPVTKTLSSIAVTTPPTKTIYATGELFSTSGMVVTATYTDSTTVNVSGYAYSPTGALSITDTTITISYTEGGITKVTAQPITVTAKALSSISVTTAPTKTTYTAGETFSAAGMVVTATYTDSTTAVVTGYTYSPTGALNTSDTTITISYTAGGVTKTTTQGITVNAAGGDDNTIWYIIGAIAVIIIVGGVVVWFVRFR